MAFDLSLTGTNPADARAGARESVFYLDPAIDRDATPELVMRRYLETGDATGLVRRPGVEPATRITYRALRPEEQRKVESQIMGGDSLETQWHWACRIACDFPDLIQADGTKGAPREWIHGMAVIQGEWWARVIMRLHSSDLRARVWGREFEALFGGWILAARVGDQEKKASSQSLSRKTSSSTPLAIVATATSVETMHSGVTEGALTRDTTEATTGQAGPSEAAQSSLPAVRLHISAG